MVENIPQYENYLIQGKTVRFTDKRFNSNSGKVILIFTDALASGTNEYVPVTYLLIEDKDNNIHTVRPRDLY